MADATDDPKTLKRAAVYLGLGAATLAWSAIRASKGLPVWPGFRAGDGSPPNAGTGAAETVLLWPAPVLWYLTSPDAKPKPAQTPQLPAAGGDTAP